MLTDEQRDALARDRERRVEEMERREQRLRLALAVISGRRKAANLYGEQLVLLGMPRYQPHCGPTDNEIIEAAEAVVYGFLMEGQ